MKKLISIVFLILTFTIMTKAQNLEDWYYDYGVSFGLGNELIVDAQMQYYGGSEISGGWTTYSSSTMTMQSTEQKYEGNYSLKFVATTNYDGVRTIFNSATLAGSKYKVSGWIYSTQNLVYVFARKGDNSGDHTGQLFSITPNQWNFFQYDYTETNDGSGGYVCLMSWTLTSGTWYVDNLSKRKILY